MKEKKLQELTKKMTEYRDKKISGMEFEQFISHAIEEAQREGLKDFARWYDNNYSDTHVTRFAESAVDDFITQQSLDKGEKECH